MADGTDPLSDSTTAQNLPSIRHATEATDQPALDSADNGGGKPEEYDRVRALVMQYKDLVPTHSNDAALVVKELLNKLSTGVYRMAMNLASHVTWDTLSPATQAELTSWAPRAKDYMEDDWDTAQHLISGFIWRLLCSRVFNASTVELCRDPAWKAYSLLVEDLRGRHANLTARRVLSPINEELKRARRYYLWQSISAVLLHRTIRDQDASSEAFLRRLDRDCLINLLRGGIGPLVPIDVELRPSVQLALEWTVRVLQELDDYIHISKGPWKIEFAYPLTGNGAAWGFPYDKSSRDMILCDSDGSERQVDGLAVDFVVRPYFYWTNFAESSPTVEIWVEMQVAVNLLDPIDKDQDDGTNEDVTEVKEVKEDTDEEAKDSEQGNASNREGADKM